MNNSYTLSFPIIMNILHAKSKIVACLCHCCYVILSKYFEFRTGSTMHIVLKLWHR